VVEFSYSYLLKIETFEHERERLLRLFDGLKTERLDVEKALGASAAFSRGVGEMRGYVAFRFQTVEGAVKGSDGDGATGAELNLVADGDAVGDLSKTKDGEQDDLLKLTEVFAGGHMFYSVDYTAE